ncbi:MAG: alpha-2-macroglobulin, partial [Paraprevotella sp.]|nr:alpha-2-macroglobulin [Paraprevotella sp.]
MYTIVKALLVSVVLLFASSTDSHAQRYDDLWEEVRQFEKEGLPKSATETVDKIARKAVNDSNKGQHMAAFLYGCVLRQQITPDSFYTDVLKLERMKTSTKDVVLRSIFASILGELYGKGVRMTHNYSEKTDAHPDSIHEWSVQQFRKASSLNYDLSMADVLSLAKVCSDIYMPFVKKGDDADYFNDDLLHVIAKRAILSKNGTDVEVCKERMNFYNQVLTTYRQLGNRNAELLFMLDSIADCTQYTSFYDERI